MQCARLVKLAVSSGWWADGGLLFALTEQFLFQRLLDGGVELALVLFFTQVGVEGGARWRIVRLPSAVSESCVALARPCQGS